MSEVIPDFDTAEDEIDFLRGYLVRANEELEQHKAITEAAKFLVKVKRSKDTKTAWYLASWPIAWKKIEAALAQLSEEG